ncbi:MAG: glycosyltransferase family 1 protein [Spirochaetes bacterium]|nr:glycosyltransferase family 1 protein [Spirochaetota bacterium]
MYINSVISSGKLNKIKEPATKIKIAIFSDVLRENLDGVSNTLYNFIKNIPDDGYELLFITPYPPLNKFRYPVVCCPYISFPLNNTYRFAFPQISKIVKTRLDEFRPDLVHFTTPSLLGLYAVKYAKRNRLPLVSTYHTHFAAYVRYYFRFSSVLTSLMQKLVWKIAGWFYDRCDLTLVPTDPVKEDMVNAGINGECLYIWGRGVNCDLYNPSKKDTDYVTNLTGKGKKRLLFVSRIVMEKDLKTLTGIYNHLREIRSDIVFIITGDGPNLNYLKKNMPAAVFTGGLAKEELAKVYASCDVFVFPSITETFGNVVLEAMASGLPVVAAAQGGPKGIIRNRKTGLLAEPEDVTDFSSRILYLLNNQVYAKKVAKNAREYALNQRWDLLTADVLNYYKRLTDTVEEENDDKAIVK